MRHLLSIFLLLSKVSFSQTPAGHYIGNILRSDGLPIVFNMQISRQGGSESWEIRNAGERIQVNNIRRFGDSLHVEMPVFESGFRLADKGNGMTGLWWKSGSTQMIYQDISFQPGQERFRPSMGKPKVNLTGRWRVSITRPNGTQRMAVAEFVQQGAYLTGTFLTPSGDYRYLEGLVTGDSMQLSCFDGSHAYFFGAKANGSGSLVNGVFAAGLTHLETWTAVRDEKAELDGASSKMEFIPGSAPLQFQFPDLDSNLVSLSDQRFKNKVVILQIMGSWCPNCMDETAFLSEYYRKNKERGVEIIGLAYEYSADFQRSKRSLMKFRDRYQVTYPMLITGVTSSDPNLTEKTLPGFTPIRAYPTTIFMGRDGQVKRIEAGYAGPATGIHHQAYKEAFEKTVSDLLQDKY